MTYRSTLLGENLGLAHDEYADAHGKVRIWHLPWHAAVFESSGGIEATHAKFIVAYHRKYIEPFGRPYYTFGNWSNLVAYTPDVRKILTDWQTATPYDEVHVSHDSRLLSMGIAMANVVLPQKVQVHATPERLDTAFLAIQRRHKTQP